MLTTRKHLRVYAVGCMETVKDFPKISGTEESLWWQKLQGWESLNFETGTNKRQGVS